MKPLPFDPGYDDPQPHTVRLPAGGSITVEKEHGFHSVAGVEDFPEVLAFLRGEPDMPTSNKTILGHYDVKDAVLVPLPEYRTTVLLDDAKAVAICGQWLAVVHRAPRDDEDQIGLYALQSTGLGLPDYGNGPLDSDAKMLVGTIIPMLVKGLGQRWPEAKDSMTAALLSPPPDDDEDCEACDNTTCPSHPSRRPTA